MTKLDSELGGRDPFVDLRGELSIASPVRHSDQPATIEQSWLTRGRTLALRRRDYLSAPIGRFREFWRVLESAFGQKDAELLDSLAEFRPAIHLGFALEELRQLQILRGRASHAETQLGWRNTIPCPEWSSPVSCV